MLKNKNISSKSISSKIICTIDVGTNTIIFLCAQIRKPNYFKILSFSRKTIQLGKSLGKNNLLPIFAQKKAINTIKHFLNDAKKYKIDKHFIAGTAVLRKAKNAKSFISKLYKTTNIKLKVLSEKQEAAYVFCAIEYFMNIQKGKYIVIDIGGGSTEIIFSNNGKITKIHSFPFGAITLTKKYKDNIKQMEIHIRNELTFLKTFSQLKTINELIGVAGTITTLSAIILKLKKYNSAKVHKSIVTRQKVLYLIKKIYTLDMNERKKIVPFDPKRAEIILAGLIILKVIMDILEIDKLKVCDKGLVYGLALI